VLYEVGERLAAPFEEAFRGTLSEIEGYPETFKPGLVYEVHLAVEPPIADASGAYDLLRYLESRYPCVGINYLGVSGDGRTVVVQLFDPPGLAGVAIAVVVIAIAVALVLYLGAQAVREVRLLVERLLPPLPPPPQWLAPAVWAGVTAALAGLGTYLTVRAFKR
jgi:hypothetical protein